MKDNKLIAEFMGWTPCDTNDNTMYANPQDESDAWSADEMRFNESWDWLMPVVDKCYTSNMQHPNDNITQGLIDVDIKATYQAVVEFIKEYNRTTDYNKVTYYDEQ